METIAKAFGAIASMIAIFFVMQSVTETWTDSVVSEYKYKKETKEKIIATENEMAALKERINNIVAYSVELNEDGSSVFLAAKFESIDSRNNELYSRVSAIESAAAIDPEKLLSISLLKKDVEALEEKFGDFRSEHKSQLSNLSSRVDSIIYGMLTVALAVLSISLPSLIKSFRGDKINK